MKVDVCFSPLLYSAYADKNESTIVVVVDVFRATTTMCAAINSGASGVIPVPTLEEARAYKEKGYLVGGERNVVKFEFADFGNTPSEYSGDKVKGRDVVISTTNGTHAIDQAVDCDCLIIGSFSNISTIARYCAKEQKNVLVLCSGWKDKFNFEDSLFGGALVELLIKEGYNASFDAAQVALSMWKEAKPDVWSYIQRSEHIKRLEAHNLLDVAQFCLTLDTANVLPVYNRELKKIVNKL